MNDTSVYLMYMQQLEDAAARFTYTANDDPRNEQDEVCAEAIRWAICEIKRLEKRVLELNEKRVGDLATSQATIEQWITENELLKQMLKARPQ
jgi:hypothetical protein